MSRYPARDTYRNGHAVTIRPASTTYTTIRPVVLGLAKLAFLPLVSAAPTLLPSLAARSAGEHKHSNDGMEAGDPDLWLYLGFAMVLVLSGGAFAGLTIALMGQDETYLQVIATSGEGAERKHARKVLDLLGKGKHWVLVTLLLSNVITNETLPIVLDRSLGGGWPAVVGSTVLIVIFGEIVPQSICVRYGLSIGAYMAPFVLLLMWSLCIVAWPTAKLLDYMLGEDHGTTYNKPGLKTLVQLHKTLGHAPSDRLMEDEVTIISSVLDLKEKSVGSIMTPMNDVFTMSADTVLDEKMMDTVLSQGYSRIPIHAPDNPRNFIGMLLVKILITYDPEDAKRVRDFALATLPETRHETSCLDIINFFQEGKSHMVLVSDFPGQDKGALGVVTLEDVIEELIGEEIIDESDVFVDVHKAIRRVAPAPHTRYKKPMTEAEVEAKEASETAPLLGKKQSKDALSQGVPPNGAATFLMRRKSSNASDPAGRQIARPVSIRGPNELRGSELRQHLGHLGPSNQASKPRATKYTSVKIKPGVTTIPEGQATSESGRLRSQSLEITHAGPDGGEGAGLLRNAGLDARDGVVAVAGYGTIAEGSPRPASARGMTDPQSPSHLSAREASELARENTNVPEDSESPTNSNGGTFPSRMTGDKLVVGHLDEDDEDDGDQLGELRETASRDRSDTRRTTRSGSITETTVDVNGMQKVVLETNSSSEEVDQESDTKETKESLQSEASGSGSKSKKKRKPKRGKGSSS